MSLHEIQQGIAAIRAGDLPIGDQLLRQGLNDPTLPPDVRAVALMWLAETSPDVNFRIQCYQMALQHDPHNSDIQGRLGALIASQTPPITPPPPPPNPNYTQSRQQVATPMPPALPGRQWKPPNTQDSQRIRANGAPPMLEFGVRGGPNGIGSGFLVVRDGLVATARFVVGSATEVTLITRSGEPFMAQVVRSYPGYDLAFIGTDIEVSVLRDTTPSGSVPPGMPLIADDYTEHEAHGERRNAPMPLPAGWFPTTFPKTLPPSFTGAPLIDGRGDVVGMLTRNAERETGLLYGLHISKIRQLFERYYEERLADPNRLYCGTCGNLSKAGAEGLYYCETCGAIFPFAVHRQRTPHPRAHLYYSVPAEENPSDNPNRRGKE